MKINYNTIDTNESTGYGKAGASLRLALEQEWVHFSDNAEIILNFCMPKDYKWGQYTIGYTPWESTKIPENWGDGLKQVDDLWTTSKWTADIFRQLTDRQDIFVLPHGLGDIWKPIRHTRECRSGNPFRFLHVGEPAIRKGGDIVLDAWSRAFKDRRDCGLIYKSVGIPTARVKDRHGSIIASASTFSNVQVINCVYSELELYNLYLHADCLIYPTRGEGFGFIPLEAMASGLPTILPKEGATGEFSNYGVQLYNSNYVDSNEIEHPSSLEST